MAVACVWNTATCCTGCCSTGSPPAHPPDADNSLQLERVEVFPKKVVFRPGLQQQLQVLAVYSDGSRRDVTRLAVFTSNAELVAEVDSTGVISARAAGETAVVVRFERMFDVANVTAVGEVAQFVATEVPPELIDRHVISKLNDVRVQPSELAGDAEFLRRVFIDLIGVQPTPAEVRAFLADASSRKREALVDELFARPEFVDHWSLKWGDLLQNGRNRLSDEAMWAFREWIRGAVAANMPLDRFARELLTAKGGVRDNPAAAYYLISLDENDTLQRVTQVFSGVRMLCAKCHNHPFENWTQSDYFGLASFFNQVTAKQDQQFPANGKARVVLLNTQAGFATNPRTGAAQRPRFLGAGEPELPASADRREIYARWLTAPDNRFFARSLVNVSGAISSTGGSSIRSTTFGTRTHPSIRPCSRT